MWEITILRRWSIPISLFFPLGTTKNLDIINKIIWEDSERQKEDRLAGEHKQYSNDFPEFSFCFIHSICRVETDRNTEIPTCTKKKSPQKTVLFPQRTRKDRKIVGNNHSISVKHQRGREGGELWQNPHPHQKKPKEKPRIILSRLYKQVSWYLCQGDIRDDQMEAWLWILLSSNKYHTHEISDETTWEAWISTPTQHWQGASIRFC